MLQFSVVARSFPLEPDRNLRLVGGRNAKLNHKLKSGTFTNTKRPTANGNGGVDDCSSSKAVICRKEVRSSHASSAGKRESERV